MSAGAGRGAAGGVDVSGMGAGGVGVVAGGAAFGCEETGFGGTGGTASEGIELGDDSPTTGSP